ncbi:MAG: low molecular weight phosphotyrosine protein phosphatase [Lachnospiraceae bacterium]|nr:low molecular weight phosphotyrosine protein phosphatase [Lachnospiraceae bacterium]
MIRVLFICHGNICRSPMAEFIMKDLARKANLEQEIEIASAATSTEEIGNDIHYGTKGILKKYNIPFTRRGARQITKADYRHYDYLVGMDTANIRNMNRIFGGDPEKKIYKMLSFAGVNRDVADPWYTGNFEETYQDVITGCQAMLQQIIIDNEK